MGTERIRELERKIIELERELEEAKRELEMEKSWEALKPGVRKFAEKYGMGILRRKMEELEGEIARGGRAEDVRIPRESEFREYLKERGFRSRTVESYVRSLRNAGAYGVSLENLSIENVERVKTPVILAEALRHYYEFTRVQQHEEGKPRQTKTSGKKYPAGGMIVDLKDYTVSEHFINKIVENVRRVGKYFLEDLLIDLNVFSSGGDDDVSEKKKLLAEYVEREYGIRVMLTGDGVVFYEEGKG